MLAVFTLPSSLGFTPPVVAMPRSAVSASDQLPPLVSSRRNVLLGAVAGVLGSTVSPLAAVAAQDVNDLSRLKKGLDQIQYLLDNWDKETTDPNSGEKSPDRVRFFLGLRSTDHPLFQSDKLMAAAQKKLPDDVEFEDWIEAIEGWNSHLNKVNELAYTSSFGEYNPGGGKEQVKKYLDLAQAEVVLSRDSLAAMIKLLGI
jgi:hypothetical protein